MPNLNWTFYKIWNDSLEQRKEREIKPRKNIWASEIGGSHIDRYLKMKGEIPTNPPNPRSLRKFEAGNMIEWVVEQVLKRAGILISNQEWLSFQYPELLEVTGKLDFFAGGNPDWEKAEAEVRQLGLPEFFDRATATIVSDFKKQYPDGLAKVVLEIKSCSSFMHDRYEVLGANKNHQLQAFHYLKAKNMPEAHIVYISKDDLRMLEFGVFNPSVVEDEYRADIEAMTKYINNDEQPPLEKELVFDEETGKFSTNWKVAYSNYLTKLYGYKDQFEFENKYKGKTAQWNRVLTRMINNQNMTKMNLEIIKEIEKTTPNIYELIVKVKERKGGEQDADS